MLSSRSKGTIPEEQKLTPTQTRLIEQMLVGGTVRAAAKVCGLSEKTAFNYLAMPKEDVCYSIIEYRASSLLPSRSLLGQKVCTLFGSYRETPRTIPKLSEVL